MCCALSCPPPHCSLSPQLRGGPRAILISMAGRQKRGVSPKFCYETFQANRRGERITQHGRREFPAALSTAGCVCVCVCVCAGEHEPERVAGSLLMVLWERAPCPGPSPEHSAPIPAPHAGEERGFLLCQLPQAPLGLCSPDSLALGPRVVAPPSLWTRPAGHRASLSRGMSPVLHSSLVVILTLPSAPRVPPECLGVARGWLGAPGDMPTEVPSGYLLSRKPCRGHIPNLSVLPSTLFRCAQGTPSASGCYDFAVTTSRLPKLAPGQPGTWHRRLLGVGGAQRPGWGSGSRERMREQRAHPDCFSLLTTRFL